MPPFPPFGSGDSTHLLRPNRGSSVGLIGCIGTGQEATLPAAVFGVLAVNLYEGSSSQSKNIPIHPLGPAKIFW